MSKVKKIQVFSFFFFFLFFFKQTTTGLKKYVQGTCF